MSFASLNLQQIIVLVIYLVTAFALYFAITRLASKKDTGLPPSSGPADLAEYECLESPEKARDELMFDLIKRRYDGEVSRWDSLDAKAGSLIGFFSIVTSLTLAAGSFNLQGILSDPTNLIVFFGGIGLLLISILFSLFCFSLRAIVFVPNTEGLLSRYGNKTYRETLDKVMRRMSKAVMRLVQINNEKAVWIRYSWVLFVIALGYLFIIFIMFTMTPQEPSEVEKLAKLLLDGANS